MQTIKKGYKQTEVGVIPSDWEVREMGEVGEVKMCRRIFNDQTTSSGSVPFYKIGTFGKEPDAYISRELYNDYRKRFSFPNTGDILISAAGTIGRTIIYDGQDAYFQDSNIVWIDNEKSNISNDFLYYIYQVVKYNTEGGTIQRLYNSILKAAKFACPPKSEQTAIATALSDADTLINSLEKLIAKKRNIKQGAMQELLKPKKGWVVKTIEKEIDLLTGFPFSSDKYSKSGIRLLRGSNVKRGVTDWNNDITQHWDNITPDLNSYILQEGDIVVAMDGSLVGRSFAQLSSKDIPSLLLQRVARIRSLQIDMGYLKEFICSEIFTKHCDSVKTSSAIPHISPSDIRSFQIPIPPSKEEQKAIANTLSDMDKETNLLEDKLDKVRKIKQGMMQNLLTGKIRLV